MDKSKYNEAVALRASDLRKQCDGGTFAGIPFDVDNPDEMIVAAYELGRMHGWEEAEKIYNEM